MTRVFMIFLWLGVYEFFSRTDSTGTYTPLPDALGSTTALTDSTGTPQTKYTYDPFGNKHHRRDNQQHRRLYRPGKTTAPQDCIY
jgi:YD repeat-containing protein